MRRQLHCRSTILACLFVVLIVPLLGGCRAEEQNRVTMYEPGVYLGKKQSALSQEQVRTLRHRTRDQAGSIKPVGGGATQVLQKNIDTRLLGQRTGIQNDL